MIRHLRYAIHHYPLALPSHILSIIFSTLIAIPAAYILLDVSLSEPYKLAIMAAVGGILGYAIAHIFAIDKMVLEYMTQDSKQATVLLLEYFTYCKTGDPKPLGSVIRTILAKRELPPKLLLELYCYRQRLTPPAQIPSPAVTPQTGSSIIPFPHELLVDLESISGIKCKDWLKVCAF